MKKIPCLHQALTLEGLRPHGRLHDLPFYLLRMRTSFLGGMSVLHGVERRQRPLIMVKNLLLTSKLLDTLSIK